MSDELNEIEYSLSQLPKGHLSDMDKEKIKLLESLFIDNLISYGYRSTTAEDTIILDTNNFLPTINNFNMKFDSSASDNIRMIWAYTMAMMQTSNKLSGNHPDLLIYDEPQQQNIELEHFVTFLNSIVSSKNAQVIIGITTKDIEFDEIISRLPSGSYKVFEYSEKSIYPI